MPLEFGSPAFHRAMESRAVRDRGDLLRSAVEAAAGSRQAVVTEHAEIERGGEERVPHFGRLVSPRRFFVRRAGSVVSSGFNFGDPEDVGGRPGRVGGARGRIQGFSGRARRLLTEYLSSVEEGVVPAMVTLTYHRSWPPNSEGVRRHYDQFEKRMEREFPGLFERVRKLEFQQRGAPHWHVLYLAPLSLWSSWVDWRGETLLLLDALRRAARHHWSASGAEWSVSPRQGAHVELAYTPSAWKGYMLKETGKSVTSTFARVYGGLRYWGVRGRGRVRREGAATVEVDRRCWQVVREGIRALVRGRGVEVFERRDTYPGWTAMLGRADEAAVASMLVVSGFASLVQWIL